MFPVVSVVWAGANALQLCGASCMGLHADAPCMRVSTDGLTGYSSASRVCSNITCCSGLLLSEELSESRRAGMGWGWFFFALPDTEALLEAPRRQQPAPELEANASTAWPTQLQALLLPVRDA